MATDLRKAPLGKPERVTRSRGGAHAAGPRAGGRSTAPGQFPANRRSTASGRVVAADVCAAAVVAVVVPLTILQIPDALAWSLPAGLAAAGPAAEASVLRAAGLALPAMAIAAPFAALAVRRFRAGPVMVVGLLAMAVADALAGLAGTVLLIGADRALHGLGAGVALTAVAAIVAERSRATGLDRAAGLGRTRRAAGLGRPGRAAQALAGWWAFATVCALAAAPALMRHRVTAGGWRAALQPSLWLTGAALILGVLYIMLAEGAPVPAVRLVFPPAERSLLALLAAPVTGLSAIAMTVAARGGHAVIAAAVAGVVALAGLAVMAARYSSAGRLAAVCALVGFTVVPAAEAVTSLAPAGQLGLPAGWAVALGAACGAALAMARPGRGRDGVAAGMFVAAAAFGAAYPAGPALTHEDVLLLLCVPLAGGMSAALAAAWRSTSGPGTGPGGAMSGVVVLLAGAVAGDLAADAAQVVALSGVRTAAVQAALVTTVTDWTLIAAVSAGAAALVTAFGPARRRSAGPGGTPDRG